MKQFIFILLGLLMLSSVTSLDTLGEGKLRENFTITQVCNNANYITLSSIQFPNRSILSINTNMTSQGGGVYTFDYVIQDLGRHDVTGISDGCEGEFAYFFKGTLSGTEPNVASYIIVFIMIGGLLMGTIWFNIKFDGKRREQLYQKIVVGYFNSGTGYRKSNLGNVILYTIAYGVLKNMFIFYYIIFAIFMVVLTQFLESYAINSIAGISASVMSIILWGFIPAFMIMVFSFYNVVRWMMDDVTKLYQGIGNGK